MELVAALSDGRSAAIAPADFLIRSALVQFARDGFRSCIALTRFSGYAAARQEIPNLTPESYLRDGNDPTINWHRSRGAHVVRLVPGGRPADIENDGYAVEMQYSMTLPRLVATVQRLLCTEALLDEDASLLSLDLSSMDLVELRQVIVSEFSVPSFTIASFFRFSSLRAVAKYIDDGSRAGVALSLMRCQEKRGAFCILGWSSVVAGCSDLKPVLLGGLDLIRGAPSERPELDGLVGGFLSSSQVWGFDSAFFNISPREASVMDPQQRMLLEHGFVALDSVSNKSQLHENGPVGVYVGLWNVDFASEVPSFHGATGRLPSVAAGRLAFALSLEGSVATIDAACASSLVAVAVAMDSGNSALVAGVNAICSLSMQQSFFGSGMLSPDGRCKTFDQKADGYGRSEACLVICVTRANTLEHPRILSCSVSHGGRASGLTAPSQGGQERVIQSAWTKAQVQSVEILESHGTGWNIVFFAFCF